MAMKVEEYHMIEVESYLPESTSGLHGKVLCQTYSALNL
jgi:hypothetical protein